MPDDRPPRRAPTATERVLEEAKRRRTDPRGVPVEIDFEHTPPPADPELLSPGELDRLDALGQIRAVAASSAATARAVAYEQQERRRGEDLARELGTLETKVGAHAAVLSELVGVAQSVESLVEFTAKGAERLEKLLIASEVQEQRDEDQAKQMDRMFGVVGGAVARLGHLEQQIALVDQRVTTLGANHGDRINKLETRVGAVEINVNRLDTHRRISVALTRREQAKAGGWGAVAGAVASALAWLAQHFIGG